MCTCAHYILKFTTFIVPYILGLNTTLRLVLVEKITQACSCMFSSTAGTRTRIPTSAPLFFSFFTTIWILLSLKTAVADSLTRSAWANSKKGTSKILLHLVSWWSICTTIHTTVLLLTVHVLCGELTVFVLSAYHTNGNGCTYVC